MKTSPGIMTAQRMQLFILILRALEKKIELDEWRLEGVWTRILMESPIVNRYKKWNEIEISIANAYLQKKKKKKINAMRSKSNLRDPVTNLQQRPAFNHEACKSIHYPIHPSPHQKEQQTER